MVEILVCQDLVRAEEAQQNEALAGNLGVL